MNIHSVSNELSKMSSHNDLAFARPHREQALSEEEKSDTPPPPRPPAPLELSLVPYHDAALAAQQLVPAPEQERTPRALERFSLALSQGVATYARRARQFCSILDEVHNERLCTSSEEELATWCKPEVGGLVAVLYCAVVLFLPIIIACSALLPAFVLEVYVILFMWLIYFSLGQTFRNDYPAFFVVVGCTVFVANLIGVPFFALTGVCVVAPLTEEYYKRLMRHYLGWTAVWAFALSEMVMYCVVFGWAIFPIRLGVAVLHVFWTARPYREGVALHWTWNTVSVVMAVMAGGDVFTPLWEHYRQTSDALDILGVVLILVGISVFISCVSFCKAVADDVESGEVPDRHVELQSPRDTLSVHDFEIRCAHLFRRGAGGLVLVTKWPSLRRFVEWERIHERGLINLWDMVSLHPMPVKGYYLFCLICMQRGRIELDVYQAHLRRLIAHNHLFGGDDEMVARRHNRLMHALNGNIDPSDLVRDAVQLMSSQGWDADTTNKIVSFILRVLHLAYTRASPTAWAVAFSRELLELGSRYAEDFKQVLARVPSEIWAACLRWIVGSPEGPTLQSGSLLQFLTSEFFGAFMRALVALIFMIITGKKVGWDGLLGEPRFYLSFASFLKDSVALMAMAQETWASYELEGLSSSLMQKSFTDIQQELDELIARPLPTQDDPEFIAKRDTLLISLAVRADRLAQLSQGRPELTVRSALAAKRIAELRAKVFTHQYGCRPVVVMLQGEAGVSKSTLATELCARFCTVGGYLSPGQTPENVTYTYRSSGTRHMDALDDPKRIVAFVFDDFGQCADPERQIVEAAIFHSLASEVKTPLPYASLPGKASATDLQPRLIVVCSNLLAFPAADSFDKGSMTRRVDLVVQMANLTSEPFSAIHRPGRMSIQFTPGTLYYAENNAPDLRVRASGKRRKNDPQQAPPAPREILLARPDDMLTPTKDKVAMMARLLDFTLRRARAYKDSYRERMHAGRCQVSGTTRSTHMGVLCSAGCSFTDLESDPTVLLEKVAEEADAYEVKIAEEAAALRLAAEAPVEPPATEEIAEDSVRHVTVAMAGVQLQSASPYFGFVGWCFWLYVTAASVLAWLTWRRVRPSSTQLFMARTVGATMLAPYFARYSALVVLERMGELNSARRERLELVRERVASHGWVRAAIRHDLETKFAKNKSKLAAVATLALFLVAAWSVWRLAANAMYGKLDLPDEDNTEVTHFKDSRTVLPKVVSGRAKVSGRLADVQNLVAACTFVVENQGRPVGYAVSSQASVCLPAHMWRDEASLTFTALVGTGNNNNQLHRSTWIRGANSAYSPAGRDIAVLDVSGAPRRDVTSHCEQLPVLRTFVGNAWVLHSGKWVRVRVAPVGNYAVDTETVDHGFMITYPPEYPTYVGLCGAPVVAELSAGLAMLLGVHHAGTSGSCRGWGQYVDRDLWYVRPTGLEVGAAGGALTLGAVLQSGTPHPNLVDVEGASTRYVTAPMTFAGAEPGFVNSTRKSALVPSKMASVFPEGGPEVFGVPELNDKYSASQGARGPLAAFGQFPGIQPCVDPEAWAKANADLALDVEMLPDLIEVRPLSLHQTLNGVPGAIKAIDMNTSAGPGLTGLKKDHVTGEAGSWQLKPHVTEQCDRIMNLKDPHVTARGVPKDEVRPLAKVDLPRIIFVMAFAFLVCMKAFLAPLLLVLRASPYVSECAVGINAASRAWSTVGAALDASGDYGIINTDFKWFDKSQASFIREAVYAYFVLLARRGKYTSAQFGALCHLFRCSLTVFVQLLGEWFYIADMQPSGDAMTVEVNSVTQRLIFRYWFYRMLPLSPVGTFRFYVWLLTYGDDGLARVKRDSRLTQITLRTCCRELGFTVTAADKGELTQYADRDSVTFLKRGVVADPEFGGYRAPLEPKSIYKMLCWFDSSSYLSEGVWSKQVLENANAEWFLHGRERFEAERPRLVEAAAVAGVDCDFRSFDSYMSDYATSTFTTWSLDLWSRMTDAVAYAR